MPRPGCHGDGISAPPGLLLTATASLPLSGREPTYVEASIMFTSKISCVATTLNPL